MPHAYDSCLAELNLMITRGVSFGKVEEWLDAQTLSEDRRAALWLYAWVGQPRGTTPGPALPVHGN